ncbi:hypothetical protein IA539_17355 [Gordonia sp. zg691]|uniref:Uncharacterized protein n=1 Tax=Gordonia jinghuaiqii TaxID=2758710 RepID=A0A7D7LUB7_9ACTN|nr:hypothetical protein [Gordonia jinghuaiqii]MBD0862954.1 hypothetical protein [Gordonia jinghuaiqii]MCR5978921.1 hypothetical protein [Gordonia jinghuaiqii]QMT01741.1 hypothetical protein H1R19_00560 [Gordonia jinghuaiqii]
MQRNYIRVTTVGAALGVAALLAPGGVATAAPVSETNCAKTSTPSNPAGWGNTFDDEHGQAGKVTATTVRDQDGSLELVTSATTPRQASYHSAGKLPLADAAKKPLTFEKSEGHANWQIRVTGANTGAADGFATLVWTASSSAGKASAAGSDEWWATRDLGDIKKGTNATLAELVEAAGDKAVVDHYGISSQPAAKAGKVNVDNVSFNGCTTNFAATGAGGAFGSLENIFP